MRDDTAIEAAKARAEARFKKEPHVGAAEAGRRAAEATRLAETAKTQRLRDLRLARERDEAAGGDEGGPASR